MSEAPVLETPRLTLRGHRLDDHDALLAMRQDPLVYRYMNGRPSTAQEGWFRLLRSRGHWELLGFGYWVVADRSTGTVLGEVGYGDFLRDMAGAPIGPEIGWSLASSVHGQGYASEALAAVVAWGDTHLASDTSWCIIVPEHEASLRLARKLGYRETSRSIDHGDEVLILERTRSRRPQR